jgi:hypothetical protein
MAKQAAEVLEELREPTPEHDYAATMTEFETQLYLKTVETVVGVLATRETIDAIKIKPDYIQNMLHSANTWAMQCVEAYRKSCRVRKVRV